MATIGNLVVRLTAKIDQFVGGMKKSRTAVDQMASGVKMASGTILTFKNLLIAAGAAGLVLMVKRSMQSIDALGKLSDRLGVATEDLLKFQYAAGISGVSADQMTTSLSKFAAVIGEARMGTGEGKDALKQLGLNPSQLARLGPAKALLEVSDAIKTIGTSAERANIGRKLFGRGSDGVMNMLLLGKRGIAELGAELEKMGGTFSRIDAAKVEAANDAMFRLKTLIGGIVNTATIELAPVIAVIATKLKDWAIAGDGIKGKVVAVINMMKRGMQKLLVYILRGVEAIGAIAQGMVSLAINFSALTGDDVSTEMFGDIGVAIVRATGKIRYMRRELEMMEKGQLPMWGDIGVGIVRATDNIRYMRRELEMMDKGQLPSMFDQWSRAIEDAFRASKIAQGGGILNALKGKMKAIAGAGTSLGSAIADGLQGASRWLVRIGKQVEGQEWLKQLRGEKVIERKETDFMQIATGRFDAAFAGNVQDAQLAELKKVNSNLRKIKDVNGGLA